ncbi:ABC transporter permease [Salinibacillus xinjiangensis]|uniref:Transport permease protein n=1 Tax=Salinibacillus xinjiangensis TaxID=1229268 RepID=A0A6G1X2G8_9BACI|nr:ABC transporter permease [Salinibacillus xinjiangensis]MRG85085.1 Teichoic acid translocation permease TagG [Salinibacillus xinjiangensis]
MFKSIRQVIKEQIMHINLIYRMAAFENRGMYQIHYLGSLWQFLNPAIQVAIYWFVFGTIRGGAPVDGTPFFLWLIIGLIPWFFISPSIIQGSNSIYQKIGLVSKMNFPVSLLPTIRIVGNSFQFFIMLGILVIIDLFYGIKPSIYNIQFLYYLICLYAFLFSFSILSSTVSTLVRDYQVALQSLMRMLLYVSPILWNTSLITETFTTYGPLIENILKLNPLFYILEGFRDSILGRAWFFEDLLYTGYFWALTFALLYFGTKIHMRFRKNFMDYM